VNFARILDEVARFMEPRDIRFGVVGAVALQAYGLARATSDLDFVVEAEAQQVVCSHLETLGYETIHRSAGYSNHVHALPALGRLDFVYVDEGTADKLFRDARSIELLPGRAFRVPRPECVQEVLLLVAR